MALQRTFRGGKDRRVGALLNPRSISLLVGWLPTWVLERGVLLELPELQHICDPPHEKLRSIWQPRLIIFHAGPVSSLSC